jgi:anion-transporting  ArsA/GET3 family ATPase
MTDPHASTPPGLSNLEEVVRARDLILVTGKGGVGKSTVVAALTRLAARHRDGAVAVELAARPHLGQLLQPDARIELCHIDLEHALPRVLGRMLHLPAILGAALNNRVLRLFVRTSPAVVETIYLDEIHELVQHNARKNRPVIVDLPATGHAVTMLDTPRSVRRMLRVGPVAGKAAQIEALLLDHRRCELVVVALPEELPVNETIELVRRAEELGLASRTVVVNQVPVSVVAAGDRGMLDLLQQQADSALSQAASAARSELDGADEARAQIERLRSKVSGPLIEVPLQVELDPAARTAAVARSLEQRAG